MSHHTRETGNLKKMALLSLGALGVVYGDIGTSPLYAINEIFFGHAELHRTTGDVLGAISVVLWALTIIVAFKYIVFVLRADHGGEGGVFALYSLLDKVKIPVERALQIFLIIAAGLLFGDGVITPAISVVSAIEGLKVATPFFAPYVVPITVAILTGLFLVQSKGTAKVGAIFGPIMVIWFATIGLLGFSQIVGNPAILAAFNPMYALQFFTTHPIHQILLALGSVMLVVTGGEAMYADMGHFGRSPIRISWFALTYPALILNYLGQGAYLLSSNEILGHNVFFSMAPSWALYPLVVLATMATIIASQALISGAFSLAQQGIQLGLLPYMKVMHTHEEHHGQIYIPFINWSLYAGCIALVVIMQKSSNLAAAYGLAVSGVMLATSISMIAIAHYLWKWSWGKTLLLWIPLAAIDVMFLAANSLKLFHGGYIPLVVALVILVIMTTWEWGRNHITSAFAEISQKISLKDIIALKKSQTDMIPKSFVVFTKNPITKLTDTSPALKLLVDRYGILPQHLVFLNVEITHEPHMHDKRYEVKTFFNDRKKGSVAAVKMHFGYMEDMKVESMLEGLAKHKEIHLESDHRNWRLHALHERVVRGDFDSLLNKIRYFIFKIIHKNAIHADYYFGLGRENKLTIEILPVYIH